MVLFSLFLVLKYLYLVNYVSDCRMKKGCYVVLSNLFILLNECCLINERTRICLQFEILHFDLKKTF